MECRPMAQMGSRTICETHDRPEIECVREDLCNANLQIGAWREYTELISAELESLAGLAHAHGWRSSRHEKGVELRKKLGIQGSNDTSKDPTDDERRVAKETQDKKFRPPDWTRSGRHG